MGRRKNLRAITFYLPAELGDVFLREVPPGTRSKWLGGLIADALGVPEMKKLHRRPGPSPSKRRQISSQA